MEVIHLNKESFATVTTQTEMPVVIDFWADWCGPCQMLAPVLQELAAAHADIIVGKVDVDQFPELAGQYGIDAIPAVFLFRNGKLEKRLAGYMDLKTLETRLGL